MAASSSLHCVALPPSPGTRTGSGRGRRGTLETLAVVAARVIGGLVPGKEPGGCNCPFMGCIQPASCQLDSPALNGKWKSVAW